MPSAVITPAALPNWAAILPFHAARHRDTCRTLACYAVLNSSIPKRDSSNTFVLQHCTTTLQSYRLLPLPRYPQRRAGEAAPPTTLPLAHYLPTVGGAKPAHTRLLGPMQTCGPSGTLLPHAFPVLAVRFTTTYLDVSTATILTHTYATVSPCCERGTCTHREATRRPV